MGQGMSVCLACVNAGLSVHAVCVLCFLSLFFALSRCLWVSLYFWAWP